MSFPSACVDWGSVSFPWLFSQRKELNLTGDICASEQQCPAAWG